MRFSIDHALKEWAESLNADSKIDLDSVELLIDKKTFNKLYRIETFIPRDDLDIVVPSDFYFSVFRVHGNYYMDVIKGSALLHKYTYGYDDYAWGKLC